MTKKSQEPHLGTKSRSPGNRVQSCVRHQNALNSAKFTDSVTSQETFNLISKGSADLRTFLRNF